MSRKTANTALKPSPKELASSPAHIALPASFGQSVKEGFGMGVGMSLAQRAVNGVFSMLAPPKSSNPVDNTRVAEYEKCMKYSWNDEDACKKLLNNAL